MSTTGTDMIDEPMTQIMHRYTGFKSIAIPRGMTPLNSTMGIIDKKTT